MIGNVWELGKPIFHFCRDVFQPHSTFLSAGMSLNWKRNWEFDKRIIFKNLETVWGQIHSAGPKLQFFLFLFTWGSITPIR